MSVSAQLSAVAAPLSPVLANGGLEDAHSRLELVLAVCEVAILVLALPLEPILAQRRLPQLQLLLQLPHSMRVVAALPVGAGTQSQETQTHQIP